MCANDTFVVVWSVFFYESPVGCKYERRVSLHMFGVSSSMGCDAERVPLQVCGVSISIYELMSCLLLVM
jgi:hypothetical protein